MTTYSTQHPARTDLSSTPVAAQRQSRSWTLAGIGAGVAGLGAVIASGTVTAVYDEALFGDTEAQMDSLADSIPALLTFHTLTMICAVLTLVFAAGLYRRLRATAGDGSTAPMIAFGGLLGTSVVAVLGSGLDTEFIFGLLEDEKPVLDPSNAVFFGHWVGTIPWLWVLAGLSGLAVYAVGRAGGAPTWIGRVGLVLGGITLVAGISPLQYMAGFVGPLWLLVTALGFFLGDRAYRS